ncbi:MAG: histidine kinase dimerization/phospho-acceptor domain-containing protein [Bacteroidota bacterium]
MQTFRASTLNANLIKAQLVEEMISSWDLVKGLMKGKVKVIDLNESTGAVLFLDQKIHSIGKVPQQTELEKLWDWLNEADFDSYFETNEFSKSYEQAKAFEQVGSGILVIRISNITKDYLVWFKSEQKQTVSWGGKNKKIYTQTEEGLRVSPRKSFAKWEEQVTGRALPWKDYEIQTALALRNDIKDFIVQKYEEVKKLNHELVQAYQELEGFSYTVSHDSRAPLRSIDGFAEILSEDCEEILDEYGISLLKVIKDNAKKMNRLIDDILMLSKLGNTKPIFNKVELVPIIREIETTLRNIELADRNIVLGLKEPLPSIMADQTLMYQLWQNLLSNAFKYTRPQAIAKIEIMAKESDTEVGYTISDKWYWF